MKALFLILSIFLVSEVVTAQPTEITNDTITLALFEDTKTYSRDALAIRDIPFALDDIQLAFMLADQEGLSIDVPPAADDSLIAALQQATASVLELRRERNRLRTENATLTTRVAELEGTTADVAALEAELTALQTQNSNLRASNQSLQTEIAAVTEDLIEQATLYEELARAVREFLAAFNQGT